jgi:hypothetical protein
MAAVGISVHFPVFLGDVEIRLTMVIFLIKSLQIFLSDVREIHTLPSILFRLKHSLRCLVWDFGGVPALVVMASYTSQHVCIIKKSNPGHENRK